MIIQTISNDRLLKYCRNKVSKSIVLTRCLSARNATNVRKYLHSRVVSYVPKYLFTYDLKYVYIPIYILYTYIYVCAGKQLVQLTKSTRKYANEIYCMCIYDVILLRYFSSSTFCFLQLWKKRII